MEMTTKEAIQMLERMLDPDPWEDYGLSDKAREALQVAIDALEKQISKGKWLRMSSLSEKDDNRYKCSCCGNVVHYKSRMDLYTFNSWCGRCGSDNSRRITNIEQDGEG